MDLQQMVDIASGFGYDVEFFHNHTQNQSPVFYRLRGPLFTTLWHGYWANLVAFLNGSARAGGDYDLQYGVNFTSTPKIQTL